MKKTVSGAKTLVEREVVRLFKALVVISKDDNRGWAGEKQKYDNHDELRDAACTRFAKNACIDEKLAKYVTYLLDSHLDMTFVQNADRETTSRRHTEGDDAVVDEAISYATGASPLPEWWLGQQL